MMNNDQQSWIISHNQKSSSITIRNAVINASISSPVMISMRQAVVLPRLVLALASFASRPEILKWARGGTTKILTMWTLSVDFLSQLTMLISCEIYITSLTSVYVDTWPLNVDPVGWNLNTVGLRSLRSSPLPADFGSSPRDCPGPACRARSPFEAPGVTWSTNFKRNSLKLICSQFFRFLFSALSP